MKKISEAVLAPHKHMSKKASPTHAHSMGLVYTPSGKEEIRPIDAADAGYGGETVADAEGGEANPGRASKKAVSPMKMQTLVKKTANEETERERLKRLRSFAYQQRLKGLGDDIHEPIYEAAPPGMEDWIKSAKPSFKKQYGKDWEKVLYATAWKKHNEMKEDIELDEISQEARRNKMRTMGVNAAIQHPNKVELRGGPIQMYRQALKNLSSKEMSNVAKKLPKVNEEGYKLVAKTKDGETFTSKTHDTKAAAQQAHYKMAKGGGYKNIKLTKVNEQNDWNGPAEENDMAMTQLHFIKYAAEEIMDAIQVGTDMEEWYQNKLTKAHVIMEGLHSYMEGRKRHYGSLGDPVYEGKMKRIATDKEETARLHAQDVLGGPVKPKSSVVGGKGQPKNLRNLTSRLATRAMKAGGSVSEEVWDKPMPDSKKQGSLSPEQKAKAKARAKRAGRKYPNMIDNMWASKQ